jgi:hypothetical protein
VHIQLYRDQFAPAACWCTSHNLTPVPLPTPADLPQHRQKLFAYSMSKQHVDTARSYTLQHHTDLCCELPWPSAVPLCSPDSAEPLAWHDVRQFRSQPLWQLSKQLAVTRGHTDAVAATVLQMVAGGHDNGC